MKIRYILVTDGSSDQALINVINWTIHQVSSEIIIDATWADLRQLRNPPRTLAARITKTIDLYGPSDALFIHRDAEGSPLSARFNEIRSACIEVSEGILPLYICVVPIRMMEAWLLIDSRAIRSAAGNPNGTIHLTIPRVSRIESIANPKEHLHSLLRTASGLTGRRLHKFRTQQAAKRLAQYISDFSQLRNLSAFREFEDSLRMTFTDLSNLNMKGA